jgi:hypothetical protein
LLKVALNTKNQSIFQKQELLTLFEHLGWPQFFGGVSFAALLKFSVLCFLCPFSIAPTVFCNVFYHEYSWWKKWFQKRVLHTKLEIYVFITQTIHLTLLNLTLCVDPGELRNKSWKPVCVLSFNMGWRILVFYPEPETRDKIYLYLPTHFKTQNTFWLPWII